MSHPPITLRDDLLSAVFTQDRSNALILLGPDARIVGWSIGAEVVFGYTPDEVCGSTLDRLFVPEDRARGAPRQEIEIALSSVPAEDDRWQLRKDGSRFWASGMVTALRRPNGELIGFCKLLRDRTEVRSQIESLGNRVRDLIQRERDRDVFLATLAHELRSPLAPLANAVEIIRRLSRAQPDLGYPVEVIERQVELLRRLSTDLGELIRLGSGHTDLQLESLDLRSAVRAGVESCRDLIEERRHQVELFLGESPVRCRADRVRLHQVMMNLITNAAKFTPAGGHVWISLTVEDDEAVIRIRDDGVGIPGAMHERVFELFTQVGTGEDMTRGGFGLGLALVKELVQLHEGSVQVQSEGENRGSEFTVRLPLEPPPRGSVG